MSVLYVVVLLVTLQRIGELLYARRNTAALLARGGVEIGASQYPFFILVHAGWLVAMALFIPATRVPNWWLLGTYALLQIARLWIVSTLGPYWTTRIVTIPGALLVRKGPYRFVRHPNYVVVCAEIAILPLAFGAIWIAIAFSLLNAALIAWRIRIEDAALTERRTASSQA